MTARGLLVPPDYQTPLSVRETERAIKLIKDTFEKNLAEALHLERVSAPLFVRPESGLNDNLNGIERPVGFEIKETGAYVEIVHSLAKWKRMALGKYGFSVNEGLYTDMNAIRRDEDIDNLHSIYVDQWDWEVVISPEMRTKETLTDTVKKIYGALLKTNQKLMKEFPMIENNLPEEISFVTTYELEEKYPELSPKERENAIAKEKQAVFIMQIGDRLACGEKHDGRAPDYDDWSLNGDILLWFEPLSCAVELSSMGIRVDDKTLVEQVNKANCPERLKMPFHQMLLKGELPLTMGGGIGQSRICMFLLKKAHIAEVQASEWPEEMVKLCEKNGIHVL